MRFEAFGLKKGGEESDPLQKLYQKLSFLSRKKNESILCIHSSIHPFIHRGRFGGTQMDAAAADDDDDDEREKEGSAKETLEKSTLRVVQRELESVPSSTKAANGKVKSTLTTPRSKSIAFLSRRLVLLYPRAAARDWNARDSLCRAFFCFAFVFLLSQVYKRRGNVFYLSTKEELLRETKEKLAEMSE